MHVESQGIVVEGDHRGRTLGFPTANVELAAGIELPDDGVYAGYARRADGSVYLTAVSVGRRPTFYGEEGRRLLEAYLLDFDGDLYGELLTVTITHFVRGQRHFDSEQDLIDQIRSDVGAVRALLKRERSDAKN